MIDPKIAEAMRFGRWTAMRSQAEGQVLLMAGMCSTGFRELMLDVGRIYLSFPAPQTDAEYDFSRRQDNALRTMIQSISHASSMGMVARSVNDQLLAEVRSAWSGDFPKTDEGLREVDQKQITVTSRIGAICAAGHRR